MNDEKDKKKEISGIQRTRKSTAISKVDALEKVTEVKKAGAVGGAKIAGSISEATQQMSYADRQKLLGMVDEEAKKLFGSSNLPPQQKKLIAEAVKMAIDTSLIPEDNDQEEVTDSD